MNEEEKAIYLSVYLATIQGVHAKGTVSIREPYAADYHPSTTYPATQHPDMVSTVAKKQAQEAVEHFRKLKDFFHP